MSIIKFIDKNAEKGIVLVVTMVMGVALLMQVVSRYLLNISITWAEEVAIFGMILDPMSANLIFSPILLLIVKPLGVDPIHFGILVTINLALGFVTPPMAGNIFDPDRGPGSGHHKGIAALRIGHDHRLVDRDLCTDPQHAAFDADQVGPFGRKPSSGRRIRRFGLVRNCELTPPGGGQ